MNRSEQLAEQLRIARTDALQAGDAGEKRI
jgi:hypothetical protein